jgi:predicted transglutaminase-like cysteine proteinase
MSSLAQSARPIVLAVTIGCYSATFAEPLKFSPNPVADADSVSSAVFQKDELNKHSHRKLMLASRLTGDARGYAPMPTEPLAFFEILPSVAHGVSAKWDELRSRIRIDEVTLATCRAEHAKCPDAAREFLQIVDGARSLEGRARIGTINRAINLKIRHVTDLVQYGIDDFWSSPLATLNAGAGDCEDYAIAKYLALREVGIASDDLRFVIGHDIKQMTDHAVVAVQFGREWLILDNRHQVLVNAEQARHFRPLFVMDHHGVSDSSTAGGPLDSTVHFAFRLLSGSGRP